MRSARVVWLGLLAALSAGCLRDQATRSTSWLDRFRQLGGPSGPNAVYIDRSDLFTVDGRMSGLDAEGIPFSLDSGHISIHGAKASADGFLRTAKYRKIVELAKAPGPDGSPVRN